MPLLGLVGTNSNMRRRTTSRRHKRAELSLQRRSEPGRAGPVVARPGALR